eukprot:jgi/Chrpa1/22295/Chrysochromulina_OHIO_Genome00009026-RA
MQATSTSTHQVSGRVASPPGAPVAVSMETTAANLKWAPPSYSGGSAIIGYRVDVRTGGHGEFCVLVANTNDPEPCVHADGLEPITWHEFRVAAITQPITWLGSRWQEVADRSKPKSGTEVRSVALSTALQRGRMKFTQAELILFGLEALRPDCYVVAGGQYFEPAYEHLTGPSGEPSEPLLTRAVPKRSAVGEVGSRRRRSKQSFGGSLLSAERSEYAACVAREAEIAAEIERSLASIASWEAVFRVRHGRVAHDEDRLESTVLRDEAHTLRVLRHAHAVESLAVLEADRQLALKELAVAKAAIAKWEKEREAAFGTVTSEDKKEPHFVELQSRRDDAAARLQRGGKRRARVMARIDVARAELQAAAQDPLASAEVLDAAGVANIGGPDYLRMLLARSSGSRAVVDELRTEHATELPEDVLQAAAAFVAMEGDERNALLTLDQFETALVGHSMAAGDAEAATVKRVRQMFAKADLNKDGFVDFNEFVAMRRLTQEHHRKLEGKHSHEPSHKAKGTGGTSLPQAEVGSWVKCVLTEKEVEGANERRAKEAQAHTLAQRVAVDDSLQDLSADDLQTLREEILTTSARLDAGACRVTLGMLAMRVGKMFTPAEVDSFVNELVRARGDGSGRIAPEQLINGLRVNVRASK